MGNTTAESVEKEKPGTQKSRLRMVSSLMRVSTTHCEFRSESCQLCGCLPSNLIILYVTRSRVQATCDTEPRFVILSQQPIYPIPGENGDASSAHDPGDCSPNLSPRDLTVPIPKRTRATLLNVALTCQSFLGPALDSLWYSIDDLAVLFKLLPNFEFSDAAQTLTVRHKLLFSVSF